MTYLSTAEVAARLGCHRRTVARLVADGRLAPAVRAPGPRGAFLFAPADVARVVADRTGKATA